MRIQDGAYVLAAGVSLIFVAPPQARADLLGVDVQNYAIVFEGGGSGNQLSINNFGTTGIWNGDLGIAGAGHLAATGPGTLDGNINFAAPNTGQASISNTTINGTVSYGVTSVQTIMNNLNLLSSSLGAQAGLGTNIAISANGNNQTIQTGVGSNQIINGVNYDLFNVTSVNTNNGWNLILQGDGSSSVVFDINSSAQFHGNVLLEDMSGKFYGDTGYAGLSPDQVLFNLYGVGDTLDTNNNGNAAHPNNIIYGDFLDPNGTMSLTNTRFVGRYLGGDSHNMQVVSGDTITVPISPPHPPQQVPSPSTLSLIIAGLGGVGLLHWRRRRTATAAS